MIYLLLKALHIVALMTWIGGMLMQAFVLRTMASQPLADASEERGVIAALASRDQRVIEPAMLLAWICGVALASVGSWWMASWLGAKLVLVVALTVLHGVQSASQRRMAGDPAPRLSAWFSHPGLVLSGVAGIVWLVVLKP